MYKRSWAKNKGMVDDVKSKRILIEVPARNVKDILPERKENRLFGILRGWRIDPQKLKDELREEG